MNNKITEFKEILENGGNIKSRRRCKWGAIEKHLLQEVIDEYMLFLV